MKRLAACLFALALLPAAADPPGRVGRLAWIEGEALAFTDPETGWEGARVNTHLTSENSVWTEPRSRAEVRAGSIALRLEETSQLDIARLDDNELHAHLARGSLAVRVRFFEKGESIFITTPGARFQVRGNGRFRIDADAGRGESRLTVFTGSARLEASGGAVIVDTGRAVVVTGGDRPSYEFETAVTTPIDEWALARDERFADGQASRYVSPRMTGWEDLDAYGAWRDEPEYGTVWYPTRVEVGWQPYQVGRWAYVRPWGWTWVDDAPWGYAPFHYGRWVNVRGRWGWYPGRYDPRPVWAPALVGWVGGSGWSLTVNSGPVGVVGWYPLSPWDRYDPWYRVNPTYVTHVNRVVIVDRRPPHGGGHYRDHVTVATRDVFGSRRPVRDSMRQVPREVVARQPVVSGGAVLPPANVVRTRPGAPSPGGSPASPPGRPPQGGSPTSPPGRPPQGGSPGNGRPVTAPSAPNVAAPAPSSPPARPAFRPREEAPSSPAPSGTRPAPVPATVPPATNAPARPAFTPRPQVPVESARPAAPASPAAPTAPSVPYAPRVSPRPEMAPPSAATPASRPPAPSRPAEAPVYRQPRGAPPEASRPKPEAPREAKPPRQESAPPPAAKPVEKPAQSTRPQKDDKPPKESGGKER